MSELRLNTDGHIIKFGADNDVSLTHVADTGLLLNSTRQLQFNDASQNINAPSATVLDINATDEIELNATLVDINANVEISGTATTTGVHTFSATPVFPDGSLALADLDIDGGTDIGAAIVDADLFIIDDGAGGTNRKVTASRLKTYAAFNADAAQVFNESGADVDFRIEADDTTHMFFVDASEDKIGINQPSPLGILHVRGGGADFGGDVSATASVLVLDNSGHGGMTIGSGSAHTCTINFGDSEDSDIGNIIYNNSGNMMTFTTNTAEAMRITSDGNVQIGTTTNNGRLTTTTASNEVGTQINCTSASYDGNVINLVASRDTTNETYNILRGQNGAGFAVAIRDSGNVENVNNSYGSSSDERIKQNITDASSQWDDIKALKIRNYKLKKDTSKTLIGVVAQELEASGMNGLVGGSTAEDKETVALSSDFGTLYEDGDSIPEGKAIGDIKTVDQKVKSVKYSVLYMKAIKALQEAQTRIETLESKVTALEG